MPDDDLFPLGGGDNYPPVREEVLYFTPMTLKRLTTIVYLAENHQIPAEKVSKEQAEAIVGLLEFVKIMVNQYNTYYDMVYAPESETESQGASNG